MKIGIAQLNPIIGDIVNNSQQILEASQQAADAGVRLLLTPELSLCGYPPRDLLLYHGFIESMSRELQSLATKIPPQLALLLGTVTFNPNATAKGEKPLFNSIALLEGGQVRQVFHKRLLPTYDVFDEDRYFQPGGESDWFVLDNLKFGVSICEDLWNDEEFWGKRSYTVNPIEELAESRVDLILNLSASPYTVNKQKLREAMLNHAAIRYDKPIIYVNQVGGNDDLIFDGNSVGFNRRGEVVCRAKACQSELILVDFAEDRQDLIPSSYLEQLVETQAEEIWQALVLGVKDYAKKSGFTKVILGLSGGIDSSLVAAIAVAAMGKDNVLGILMPSPYSSQHSITDALALAKNLGIQTEQFPIQDIMSGYDRLLEPLFAGTSFGIAEENIQSRIRGNLLMAIANKFGYLLLSTGNKSEMAVGYCTLYGDMNGGLAVIADLPKTCVFDICHWIDRQEEIIPANVLTKPPSAELKPGQLDRDSLPPYEILDDILYQIVHQHKSELEIVRSGHEAATVSQVMKLVARAEFKRRQAPPGLKITDRAFGTGWRMPIASRWLN
jgi:NAD+ synthase (glutamine-hydrolysing)